MNATTIFVTLMILMGAIAYVSGGQVAEQYGTHMIYDGHNIYIANQTIAQIDGNPANVINVGEINIQSYKIYAVYPSKQFIILSHSIDGYIGSEMPIGMSYKKYTIPAGKDIHISNLNLIYYGDIGGMDVYDKDGILIGTSENVQSIFVSGSGHTIMIKEVKISGITYTQIIDYFAKYYAMESIILLTFMIVTIYIIGFAMVRNRS